MESRRCLGETKFFRQCPRYVISNDHLTFCYEHAAQEHERPQEVDAMSSENVENEWAPLGAFLTNKPINESRLRELASDNQNVHTSEVQTGVAASICRLRNWAKSNNIKTYRDIISEIFQVLGDKENQTIIEALQHLAHCYLFSDDTQMFNTTYPELVSWVWARVSRDHEHKEILMERFFQEVSESAGQCLNGNMARLMNVFAGIDSEMSPQQKRMTGEQLQSQIARAVTLIDSLDTCLIYVSNLLNETDLTNSEKEEWLSSVKESY